MRSTKFTVLLICSLSTRHEGQIIPLAKCMQIHNNVAVTIKRSLVVLRVLRIKLCRTIVKVRISTALTKSNSCTNIELKYRGSFSSRVVHALKPFFIDRFTFACKKYTT